MDAALRGEPTMADDGEKLDEERACNSKAAARAVIDDRSFVMMIPNDDDASIFGIMIVLDRVAVMRMKCVLRATPTLATWYVIVLARG